MLSKLFQKVSFSQLLVILMLTGFAFPAGAITVTSLADSGPGTLRDAIDQANLQAGPDVIDFAPGLSGAILLTTVVANESVLPVVSESLQILGPGRDILTINALPAGNERVFLLKDGMGGVSEYEISGLSIRGGSAHDIVPNQEGGGAIFLAEGDTLSLKDCDLSFNGTLGGEGGALRLGANTNVSIGNCDIHDNFSAGASGAISNFHTDPSETGTLLIQDSSIRDNQALGSAVGGISRVGGTMMILNSSITGNWAKSFGGGFAMIDPGDNMSGLVIENSTIADNISMSVGIGGGASGAAENSVINSTISGNSALMGNSGGMNFFGEANVHMVNSTISGNVADQDGGGLRLTTNGMVRLFNVTLTNNTADADGNDDGDGGGLFVGPGTNVAISNSILAGNSDPSSAPDCFGTLTSGGYNLIGNDENCDFMGDGTDQVGTPAAPLDAGLEALASNGGPTQTHAITENSLARNMGNPNGCVDQNGSPLGVDQRGEPRPGAGSTRCDVGAYEFQQTNPPPPPPPPNGGGNGCSLIKGSFSFTGQKVFWMGLMILFIPLLLRVKSR